MPPPQRATYGVDAPGAIAGMAIGAVACAVFGMLARSIPLIASAVIMFAMVASFLYTTRRGKFAVWRREIRALELRGDERVLDLGCGRGAVLLLVAHELTSGRATGVDLWRSIDQSGNDEEVTRSNAELEGVADRVDLLTADMRELPVPDASFDLVVSSLAIHNIGSAEGRMQAVSEAFRVLKPGGRVRIADFRHAGDYADALKRLGAEQVCHRRLGWRFWYGTPFHATSMVEGCKPPGVEGPATTNGL